MFQIFIVGSLCKEDLEGIKEWSFTLTPEDADLLTPAGEAEHFELGERWKIRLPTIFDNSYTEEKFKV